MLQVQLYFNIFFQSLMITVEELSLITESQYLEVLFPKFSPFVDDQVSLVPDQFSTVLGVPVSEQQAS